MHGIKLLKYKNNKSMFEAYLIFYNDFIFSFISFVKITAFIDNVINNEYIIFM